MVERDEEEVRALDRLEHARRVRTLEHRIAEIAAHPVEHRGAGQELHLLARYAREMLDAQVVRDEAVVAREGRPGNAALRLVPECERGEVQACGPSLGGAGEVVHLLLRQFDPGLAQKRLRLVGAESELHSAELEQPVGEPQPLDGKTRLHAAPQRDLRPGREVPYECGDHIQRLLRVQRVHVVEDEHERLPSRAKGEAEPRYDVDQIDVAGDVSARETDSSSGSMRSSAAITCVSSTVASLSRSSTCTHANLRRSRPVHWASSVVFP